MTRILIVLFAFIVIPLIGQDDYHSELLDKFQSENGLENGVFLFNDNEQSNINDIVIYGNVTNQTNEVSNANYSLLQKIRVNAQGNNQWDAGYVIRNKSVIESDDIVLITFVARRTSTQSELFLFAEDVSTFEKETYTIVNLEPDWNTYYLPVRCSSGYGLNRISVGFHMASIAQEFEIAGFTAINYGSDYPFSQFPSSFGPGGYDGSALDAEWRERAADRIENIRKANIDIEVTDQDGNTIEGAQVDIKMKSHLFGFGSAFVSCRFPGNNCFNPTYVNKIFDLDGKGHSFNVGVTENALKWDGWEEEWIASPQETVAAIEYLHNQGVEMRGHTLIWPGYTNMPDDINENKDNREYVKNRVDSRIETMINHPVLGEIVTEWDVLNEITQNRDLEFIFQGQPGYESGREIYQDIFEKVKELNSDSKIYVNDYVVLSGGGSATSVVNRYRTYLDELNAADIEWEGIGFQCHIGAQPTSLNKIEQTLDDFYDSYGKRVKITEYDISPNVSEEVQAAYMSDFLTMVFSHPSVDAFLMWGFWDGNHWKGNAPMFDINWNLKPSGQAFIDKVFRDWWTEDSIETESDGLASFRAFKGKYEVSITMPNGEVMDTTLTLSDDISISLGSETTVAVTEIDHKAPFTIFPNPVTDLIQISRNSADQCEVKVMSMGGKIIHRGVYKESVINIPLESVTDSIILVNITALNYNHTEKVMIKK